MGQYSDRVKKHTMEATVGILALLSSVALITTLLVREYYREELEARAEWQPQTEGERLYGRPSHIVSSGGITCRYWNWQHPYTTGRTTIEECLPQEETQ